MAMGILPPGSARLEVTPLGDYLVDRIRAFHTDKALVETTMEIRQVVGV